MRNLKFRVWDTKNKEWIKDLYSFSSYYDIINETWGCWDSYYRGLTDYLIIQQFTGLSDKNNKEIYEGDIVNVELLTKDLVSVSKDELPYIHSGFVFYDPNVCSFRIQFKKNQYCIFGGKNLEVVGNILENPELLNE